MFYVASEDTPSELEKPGQEFVLLPRAFMGALVDKFMGGCLGGKGWPAGTIQVAELYGEYSFLGLESISRCCKYRGYIKQTWMGQHILKELYQGCFILNFPNTSLNFSYCTVLFVMFVHVV